MYLFSRVVTPLVGTRAWATPHYARALTRINVPPPVRVEFYVAYAFGPPEIISFAAFYPEGGLGWRDRHTRTGTVLVGDVKVQN